MTACRHHWLIAAPEGPTSPGRCKLCGETREFANYGPVDAPERWRKTNPSVVSAGKIAMEYVGVTKRYEAW